MKGDNTMSYKAIHKRTKKEFEVIGKDSVGTLLRLKEIGTGITVTSNRGFYDIYNDNGDFIDEDGVVHQQEQPKQQMEVKPLKKSKIKQIIKDYHDYITSPFSDGYTSMYLESKYNMTMEEMRKVYEQNRPKKALTDKALLKKLAKEVGEDSACFDDTSIVVKVRNLLKDNGYLK